MKNYDIDAANRYFRDRVAFTTGVHELEVLITGKTDKSSYQVVDVRYPADFTEAHGRDQPAPSGAQGLDKDALPLLLHADLPPGRRGRRRTDGAGLPGHRGRGRLGTLAVRRLRGREVHRRCLNQMAPRSGGAPFFIIPAKLVT